MGGGGEWGLNGGGGEVGLGRGWEKGTRGERGNGRGGWMNGGGKA